MLTYDYFKQALKDVSKPAAFIEKDLFDHNAAQIAAKNNNKQIRIASKSVRSVEVLRDIMNASPVFQGIMSFAPEEALYLNDHGFNDILIAYPALDSEPLKQIAKRTEAGHIITVMADSIEHVDFLETLSSEAGGCFKVCLDIDVSSSYPGLHFGTHRSPIKTTHHALALVNRIHDSRTLHLDGIMGYEAQIAGVPDNNPNQKMKNKVIRLLKKQSSKSIKSKRESIINALKEKGIKLRFVNGGGTGSLHLTAAEDVITEVTVGSGFFNPHLFDDYTDYHNAPAMGYAIEITRQPEIKIFTCRGGGYIASGAGGADKQPMVYLPQGAELTANEGAGEVQTPVYYDGDIDLKLGDPIIMRHSKAGELCEHFHNIHIIKDGAIIDTYTTYRGDRQCFL